MSKNRIPVAVQLYSLRDVIGDDVPGTLKALAAMGYDGVEFAGYYGLAPADLRRMLDDCGLQCAGSHTGLQMLDPEHFDTTVAMNRALGTDRLIIPGMPMEDMNQAVETALAIHERCKTAGMRTGYHNHQSEFERIDGVTKLDYLFSRTPDDFLVQLDIGWATAAGADIPDFLRRYARRVETVHVKEFNPDDPAAPVGEGSVDWPKVFDILEQETAVEWYIAEQEQYRVGPMESAGDCIENIRKMGR